MSVNAYKPHLLVLPEDDANRQIAVGFSLDTRVNTRQIQVLPCCGGWLKVLDSLCNEHVKGLQTFSQRRIVMLIDFDDDVINRSAKLAQEIPQQFASRIFVLGVKSEPEKLRGASNKKLESIGETLANECAQSTKTLWSHPLLAHNTNELGRLMLDVKPFLFS
jgi:hypothetical protein